MAKKRRKKSAPSIGKLLILIIIVGLIFGMYHYKDELFKRNTDPDKKTKIKTSRSLVERVEANYGKEIDRLAKEFNLPASYLKALVALECSGNKPPGTRFEKHVFNRLKQLRSGQIKKYENLRVKTVKNMNDAGLKNLATSWGPFQLMGYKCVLLGIYVRDIRGENALYWGVKWINLTYGKYLRQGKYKDAFHMHNTGQRFPRDGKSRTYDPKYVEKGLAYMEKFR